MKVPKTLANKIERSMAVPVILAVCQSVSQHVFELPYSIRNSAKFVPRPSAALARRVLDNLTATACGIFNIAFVDVRFAK